MNREVFVPGTNKRLMQTAEKRYAEVSQSFRPTEDPEVISQQEETAAGHIDIFGQASQLTAKAKVGLIRRLMTQLEVDQVQTILEFGLQEIGERHRRGTAIASHNTRLLLKKDYTYQERGLNEPSQYYVYLRRRQPKLDRYIGTLFYVPQGCTLSYFLDAEGQLIFNPPHNVFQLQDCDNRDIVHIVRLICLEPPPPDYNFTRQQNDTPAIYLHLEYLDPKTYQPLTRQVYPFPVCMHEGGRLDRYRWEVSTVTLPSDPAMEASVAPMPTPASNSPADVPSQPSPRRVLELPTTKTLSFYLTNPNDSKAVLKRMRLWVVWSEKAMPQSKWAVIQEESVYSLINAHFKRTILQFDCDRRSIILEHSPAVLMKWFHDLSLAVSQTANQQQYSVVQLKLARSLFVEMSLPHTEPLVVLQKLFGVEFSISPD